VDQESEELMMTLCFKLNLDSLYMIQ